MRLTSLPLPEILLRIGLAVSFLYPPVAALQDPYSWIGYFPAFMTALAAGHEMLLLHAFGAVEIVIALAVLFRKNVFIPCLAAAVILLAIIVLNVAQFPILFRDVSILFMALALAVMHRPWVMNPA